MITATCWRVPGDPWTCDLYERLGDVVAPGEPPRGAAGGRLVISDSKALYKSGAGVARLELGVLAAATNTGHSIDRWQTLFQSVAPGTLEAMSELPWYAKFGCQLPLHAEKPDVARAAERLSAQCGRAQIVVRSIRARVVFAPHFNALLSEHGSKATALSRVTIDLLTETLSSLDEPTLVICDKHGARNQYQRLLQSASEQRLVEVRRESRQRSIYGWGFAAAARGSAFLRSRGTVSPSGAGLDDVEVPSRVGDAGVQSILVRASSQSAPDRRLSSGCTTFSRGDSRRPRIARVWRPDALAGPLVNLQKQRAV